MDQVNVKVSFYLKKSEADANGMCPVMAKLNVGKYSEVAFSAKLRVSQTMWNSGRASGKSVKAKEINNRLDEIRAMALGVYAELSAVCDGVTAENVKSQLLGMAGEQKTLLSYFRVFIQNFAKRVGVSRTEGSLKSYKNAYNHIERFLREKYSLSDIPFSALNRSFIDDYDAHLRTDCHLSSGSIINMTVLLKGIVGEAIADGIITVFPFTGYEPVRPKQRKRYLTSEELQRIMTTPLGKPHLYLTRDMFLFSCYTGIPYADMRRLSKEHLSLAADGTWWIKSARKKTGVEFEIPLLELPLRIIKKYDGMASDGKLLPMYCNSTLNLYLKEIARLCGIDCTLVFHQARHTYATVITLGNGVPLETVSKMLGHSRVDTTQHYAKVTDDKINADTQVLNQRISECFSVVI